jgi:hypothetical protein
MNSSANSVARIAYQLHGSVSNVESCHKARGGGGVICESAMSDGCVLYVNRRAMKQTCYGYD